MEKSMIDHGIVLPIINAALNGDNSKIDESFSVEEYLPFVQSQQIEALFIAGLKAAGIKLDRTLRDLYIRATLINDHQLDMAEKLYSLFSEHYIDYMPLKGCILKGFYPAPEMRSMSDLDILVRIEQYNQIRPLMLENGFIEDVESDHEYIWNKDGVHIELHKRLIPSYNKDYYAYFGEGWQLAKPASAPYRYEMSPEDTFIFIFTHYAKHYRDAGVGIRQGLDLYVYRKAYPDMDEDYVRSKLKLLQLDRFYENTMHMLHVWFDGHTHTEASQLISDRLFDNGVFGTKTDSLQSTMLKQVNAHGTIQKAKVVNWLDTLFLPYASMRKKYSVLEKCPVLLPFMWVVRWFDVLLNKRSRIKIKVEQEKTASEKNVNAYREMLHKSGLDFNFK